MPDLTLGPEDPTIFAKCVKCDPHRPGASVGTYFGKAYTRRKADRNPKCENCKSPMTILYEVKT